MRVTSRTTLNVDAMQSRNSSRYRSGAVFSCFETDGDLLVIEDSWMSGLICGRGMTDA